MSEWVSEWMNEWVSEWVNEWMNQWMSEWMNDNEILKECMQGREVTDRMEDVKIGSCAWF